MDHGPLSTHPEKFNLALIWGKRKVQDPDLPAWRMAPAQVEGPEAAYLPPRKLVDASFGA